MAPWQSHGKAPASEVQMSLDGVHMWHFADVKPQALQKHLGIGNQSAGAKLWTRVVRLLKNENAFFEPGRQLSQVQRRGEARRPAANDEDIGRHAPI